MSRQEFLDRLREALAGLPAEEIEDALSYFDDMIADRAQEEGISEEAVIATFEPVQTIAQALREGKEKTQQPQQPSAESDEGFGSRKTLRVHPDSVRNLLISTSNVSVELKAGKDDELTLSYTQDRYDIYDYSLENGELRLIRRPLELLDRLRLGFFIRKVEPLELRLPREFAANCEISTSNAPIEAKNVRFWGSLTLKTSNSKISLEEVSSQSELQAKTSNGSIRAEQLEAKSLRLITSNSKISAEDLKASQRILLHTSNSKLEARRCEATDELMIRSSNGSLSVEALAAKSIRLETSNANIRGSLSGAAEAYSVESYTSNGKNNLSGHPYEGGKQLYARTRNGNISLEFTP